MWCSRAAASAGRPTTIPAAAAAALDLPLALHPEAEQAIALRTAEMAAKGQGTADMSAPENQQRLQMGVFPEGCEIVPNPTTASRAFSSVTTPSCRASR